MQMRELGQTGAKVSAIGLGCWGMSGAYGAADQEEAEATLHHALDLGINFLDTADVYGEGHNERLLGRVLKSRRDQFVLATKTGFVKADAPDGTATIAVDASPQRIRSACDASLQRLQTDVIDLYYLHRVDPRVPIEESVGAVAELIKAGKVRYLGLCEAAASTIRRAHAVVQVTAVQSEYSLWTRDVEAEVLPLCEQLSISLVPFSPLGRGFLTGQVVAAAQISADDWRATNPRFTQENIARNAQLLKPLNDIAHRHGGTPAQVALTWLLAQSPQIIPIPGTKRRRHLEENLAALKITLTDEELLQLQTEFQPGAVAGERYTAEFARWIDHS